MTTPSLGVDDSLLEVTDLYTDIASRRGVVHAVGGVSLHIKAGETVGLVGESGCGKTMTAMSIIRLLPSGGAIVRGSVRLAGRDLVPLDETEIRGVRGDQIGVVFQDPMTSLNPTMTIGHQIGESVRLHRHASRKQAESRAKEVLGLVGMPRPAERLDDYPHQLSGGLRQRALIALALACEPKLLIADEPTTALDVTIQAQILELLDDLRSRLGMGMLLVTHDMGVIAGRTDRVMVMYAGRIVESASTEELFTHPTHPYTEALLESIPKLDQDRSQRLNAIPGMPPDLVHPPAGCRFAARCAYATEQCRSNEPILGGESVAHRYACFYPRTGGPVVSLGGPNRGRARVGEPEALEPTPLLSVLDVSREYPAAAGLFRRGAGSVKAVSGVSFSVERGGTFGLVGESGCGKSTLGRLIVAMEQPDQGSVLIDGVRLDSLSRIGLRRKRRDVQIVFQDSYSAMDPRMRVGASMREPLRVQGLGTRSKQNARVAELLDSVGLPRGVLSRYPHELSGGQRQRVGFARALTLNPKLIVADEPVSALDVSIQAQLINLMTSLQEEFSLTYVMISHDLSVIRYVADRIGVMYLGKLVEIGPSEEIYKRPAHPYTAGLLEAIPLPNPARERAKPTGTMRGELPSAVDPPSGCRFRTRCPRAEERCAVEEPQMHAFGPGHLAACHFPLIPPVSDPEVGTPVEQLDPSTSGQLE